jgi:putative methionine-R-sulfoxide reductase with GAF domain
VLVNDLRNDPRYLVGFGDTLAEIIIPVRGAKTGTVVGTIDVEGEAANAFSSEDQKRLEEYAVTARASPSVH